MKILVFTGILDYWRKQEFEKLHKSSSLEEEFHQKTIGFHHLRDFFVFYTHSVLLSANILIVEIIWKYITKYKFSLNNRKRKWIKFIER